MKDNHLTTERRFQTATQELINIKWWLTELVKHSTDSYVRIRLTEMAGQTRKVVDSLLSEDFVYDATVSNVLPGQK